jgi:SAM-dependent methyltransferase
VTTGGLTYLEPDVPVDEVLDCPGCGQRLRLRADPAGPRCAACGWVAGDADGVLDFARDPAVADERAHYEAEYADEAPHGRRPISELADLWRHPAKPVNIALDRRIGEIAGKRVVLIGNGGSAKELHFLTRRPRLLLYTDLTTGGVRAVVRRFALDGYRDRVAFAAMDAMRLPLRDGSVDLVYGNAIIHHVPERDRCLREINRVLAPGGRTLFMDDGYGPLWQRAKLTLLRPMMRWSHRREPRSPEDLRHTMLGGFREQELEATIRSFGGEPFFERQGLLFYLWHRASMHVFPRRLRHLGDHRGIGRALTGIDEWLARYPAIRRNQLRLIWGWRRPPAG